MTYQITISGERQSGKSTAAFLLREALEALGCQVHLSDEPKNPHTFVRPVQERHLLRAKQAILQRSTQDDVVPQFAIVVSEAAEPIDCNVTQDDAQITAGMKGVAWHIRQVQHFALQRNHGQAHSHMAEAYRALGEMTVALARLEQQTEAMMAIPQGLVHRDSA